MYMYIYILYIRSSMHSPSDSGVNISNPSTESVYQQEPGLDYTVQRRDHVAAPPYQAHTMITAAPTASQHNMIRMCFYILELTILILIKHLYLYIT